MTLLALILMAYVCSRPLVWLGFRSTTFKVRFVMGCGCTKVRSNDRRGSVRSSSSQRFCYRSRRLNKILSTVGRYRPR
ncbi:hypothetical protein ACRBEV_12440 [Methylobacterium phyllosphaerae]